MDEQRATLSPASISKLVGALASMLDAAVHAHRITVNPCKGVRMPSTYRPQRPAQAMPRETVLDRLLPAVDAAYRPLVATAAGAGLRWGECLGLTWAAVDFTEKTLRITQTVIESGGRRTVKACPKTRAGRRSVPMPAFLVAELRRLYREKGQPEPDALVFTTRTGQPPLQATFRRDVWRPALVQAGLLGRVEHVGEDKYRAHWTGKAGTEQASDHRSEREAIAQVAARSAGGARFHDLRHSYATWLVSDGLPVNVVQRVLGQEKRSTLLNLCMLAPSQFEDRVRDVFDRRLTIR